MKRRAKALHPDDDQIAYNFAVLRVVPHVHTGAFAPVGVIVHARTSEFLDMRVITNKEELSNWSRFLVAFANRFA